MKLKLRMIYLIVVLMSLCEMSSAQSLLHSLPPYKPPVKKGLYSRSLLPTDTLPALSANKWNGLRLAGPDVMAALPDFTLYTGVGLDYVWATANNATGKWDYDYTVGVRLIGGANLPSPGTVKAVGGFGVRMTFFKGLLAVGGIYNLTLKHAQAAVGNPVALIPGLN